jgi:flavodoxin
MNKVLIVFYSMTGNVKLLAKKAARLLNADVEELIDQSKWTGVDGFFRRAHRAIIRGDTVLNATKYDPKDYEKIIVFSPHWGKYVCPAIRTYLKQNMNFIRELSLVMLGSFTKDAEGAKKELESLGFNIKNIMNLFDKGQAGKETGELQGENLTKLKEFIEML